MPAPLETFLHYWRSGHTTGLSDEMYQHFGGDELLKTLQQYDPNATFTDVDLGGGEGGSTGKGKRLDFDITKLPKSKLPNGKEVDFASLSPSNMGSGGLINDKMVWDDPLYGSITDSRNVKHKNEGIEKWAPLIAAGIAMGGPLAGGLLAGAGVGLGVGGTSAVTGAAAGLGAGQIPGALGAGSSLGLSDGLLKLLGRAPQTVGPQLSSGRPSWASLLAPALGATGVRGASSLPLIMRLLGK